MTFYDHFFTRWISTTMKAQRCQRRGLDTMQWISWVRLQPCKGILFFWMLKKQNPLHTHGVSTLKWRSIEDEHLYTLSQHDGANPAVGASTRTVQSPTLTLSSSVTGSSSVFTQHLQTSHENDPILQALQGARWNILERLSRITWISRTTAGAYQINCNGL